MYDLHFEITNNNHEKERMWLLPIHFEHFHIVDFPVIYMKSQSRPYNMKALDSSCSGIDDQHIPLRIPYDLEDMRVPAYEYIGMQFVYQLAGARVISPGISSYMGHQDLHSFTLEETMERMGEAQIVIVTVSCHSDQRLEGSHLSSKLHTSPEITGVPYLIHLGEELPELRIENAVSV
jgi:hypothetical protein